MAITLEQVDPKTVLFEEVNDQAFLTKIRGKVIRDVLSEPGRSRVYLKFTDGSSIAVDEERGKGKVVMRYLRSGKEKGWE
ncbi:MAG TPA: hypothetical protein PLN21_11440 [Gemmatales bacterium]|nr:hypothetical protein [Gemmatales bacterium]